jgi:hypothetical protein
MDTELASIMNMMNPNLNRYLIEQKIWNDLHEYGFIGMQIYTLTNNSKCRETGMIYQLDKYFPLNHSIYV